MEGRRELPIEIELLVNNSSYYIESHYCAITWCIIIVITLVHYYVVT